jgi:glycosyltransferase involved in cell wall biosynthesis
MGGAERVTVALAAEASESQSFRDVEIFVLSGSPSGTLTELSRRAGVTVTYTGASTEKWGLPRLILHVIRREFDFVFSSHAHINALTSLLRRTGLLHARRVVARESTQIFQRELGWSTPFIRGLYRCYGAHDMVVCQTERMLLEFNRGTDQRFSRAAVVLPNPSRLKYERPTALRASATKGESPSRVIVWCGRFVPVKRPVLALSVLAELIATTSWRWHLVMIGDGPLLQCAKAAAEALPPGTVSFVGYAPDPSTHFRTADIGMVTSEVEGFPNVILEMLAAGVGAVVTTDCAGDLRLVPGVTVADTALPVVHELAKNLRRVGRVDPGAVEEHLAQRSPSAVLARMLGK